MSSRVETRDGQVRGETAQSSSNSLKTNPASAVWPRAQGQSLKVEWSESSLPSGIIKEECAVKHTAWLHASVSISVEWAMSRPSEKERGSGPWHVTSVLPVPLQVQCPPLTMGSPLHASHRDGRQGTVCPVSPTPGHKSTRPMNNALRDHTPDLGGAAGALY